jgi:hypothetical protein
MIMPVRLAAILVLATLIAGPAAAQMAGPGGVGGPGSPDGTPTPQPRVPDIAPPGAPGIGAAPLATAPGIVKATTGDPTTALFAAVNSGDYNAAQDAVSRGANIDAQNALGETPLELAIALNRTQITFLLLANRNDTAVASGPPPAPSHTAAKHVVRVSTPPVKITPPAMGNQTGTPDPKAGFLGFGK